MDLGTTFVAAARSDGSQIEIVTLGDRSVVMPSVVFVGEDGDTITGEAADRRATSCPERVARQFKRRLGDPTPVRLGDANYSATDLLAVLLREVVARVTTTEGEPPGQVVLTHPANWGRFRRGVFEEVPRAAGISDALTLTEPEAAALHYATTRRLGNGELIAVYDLGGGTFDATVVRKTPDGVATMGTPEGVERLGGIDFDQALFDFVNFSSGGALGELDMGDPKTMIALARLRQDCVLAKESLSVDTETLLPVFLPGRHFDVRVTRGDFEDLIRAQIESTITALSRTLRSAQVSADELNAVLLVGGSSRIPLVAQMVSEELGRPILIDTHPKYAVALGAATPTDQPITRRRTAPGPKPARPARPRSVHLTLRRTGAAVLTLAGVAALAWPLILLSGTPPGAPPSPAAPVLPAVLPPPRQISLPGRTATGLDTSAPIMDVLTGASLSEIDADTLTQRWTVTFPTVPDPGGSLKGVLPLDDEAFCVRTSPAECVPVNRVTHTVEPALPLPGPGVVFTAVRVDGSGSVVMLSNTGTLSMMDTQTRAVRSAPVAGWQRAGVTLFGVGGHRAYVVANDEAPAPIVTVVDLDSMAVTTSSWPRAARPPHGWGSTHMIVSPDERALYAVQGQNVLVFDTATMTLQRTIPQPTRLFDCIGQTDNGRYLFVTTQDGVLRVIEAAGGRQVSTAHVGDKCGIVFDRGRKVAVPAGDDYGVYDTSAFAGS